MGGRNNNLCDQKDQGPKNGSLSLVLNKLFIRQNIKIRRIKIYFFKTY